MSSPAPLVTLLTDFGTADGYVGEMKGVLKSGVPGVEIIDITHDVPPQDVEAGRLGRSMRSTLQHEVSLQIKSATG